MPVYPLPPPTFMTLFSSTLRLACAAGLGILFISGCAQTNGVVNLSHYDSASPDFGSMRRSGIVGVIHEATYPPETGDPEYAARQEAATRAGLLWGAYHFANGSDPVRQADQFLDFVAAQFHTASPTPRGVLLVLDFEQNNHYPGGTMYLPQAVAFIERIKERTGKYPGLYSNENRIKNVIGRADLDARSRRALEGCWLWVANYHQTPGLLSPWSHWTLWQYTGDGVCELPRSSYPIHIANVHNAERNIFRGSASDLRSFWKANAWYSSR